jgi:hypothetical protein
MEFKCCCVSPPVADGFQPALTAKNRGTDLRGQHAAAFGQFGLPGIVDGDVAGILGIATGVRRHIRPGSVPLVFSTL